MPKLKLALLALVASGLLLITPSLASADCTLPTTGSGGTGGTVNNNFIDPADSVTKSGNFKPELNGQFIQVPFEVPADATGLRIRYCYDEAAPVPNGSDGKPINNTTLDLGVYEPKPAGQAEFAVAQSRGWSGSAVKIIGIGENGFTDGATYNSGIPDLNASRKAYVPGKTNRAYRPGEIKQGTWAVELGVGYIDPLLSTGADWSIQFTWSDDDGWSNDAFEPTPFVPVVGNAAAGWYQGDLHVHGEQEPGNALVEDTLDLAFDGPPNGVGLDFVTLVDHNNNISRSVLGDLSGKHPGKVVIPGTEMTTYDGHFNAQGPSALSDFRLGEIKKFVDANSNNVLDPGELRNVRGKENPSDRFARIDALGGFSQINHPTIFKDSPAACRGCAWNYTDAQTDFSKVDAIELQTGPAGIPAGSLTPGPNPFTDPAIAYYEHALATGAHIAAVGSSDDHKAGGATGPFDSQIGSGATVVHADQLSPSGITAAVKADHTYVKLFGPDAPDVELKAGEPGKAGYNAIPGDSVTGETMNIQVKVTGISTSPRPGPYTLEILKDGVSVDSIAASGATFDRNFTATSTGRYSFKLSRMQGTNKLIEAYSTPVWFTYEAPPSNRFSFRGLKLNKKRGTARLRVKVAAPGVVRLAARNVATSVARPRRANQVVVLNVRTKGKLARSLKKRGRATVRVRVTNKPTGGKAKSAFKTVKLKQIKRKKRR